MLALRNLNTVRKKEATASVHSSSLSLDLFCPFSGLNISHSSQVRGMKRRWVSKWMGKAPHFLCYGGILKYNIKFLITLNAGSCKNHQSESPSSVKSNIVSQILLTRLSQRVSLIVLLDSEMIRISAFILLFLIKYQLALI